MKDSEKRISFAVGCGLEENVMTKIEKVFIFYL